LTIAFGVNVTGVVAAAGAFTTSGIGVALAVAIGNSPQLLLLVYARAPARASALNALYT